ncbi:MAG: hypothetical protein IJW62_05820 [Clostridia bacterium]|nr:hypothetical protein [Clostridia bacterium]
MLNKKSLFNIVYAIGLIGAVMACFGMLNEFLNVAQLYDVYIPNTHNFSEENYWIPLLYYFFAFVISAFAVTMVILQILNVLKERRIVNISIIAACGILFLMSCILVLLLRYDVDYHEYYLQYYDYLIVYSLRSGVLSFIANMGIILFCNRIDAKSNTVPTEEQTNEQL